MTAAVPPAPRHGLAARLGRVLLVAGVVAAAARVAWVADDAFVPLRVARQLWAGHGLVWNADERVQVFTSPLWTLLVAALAPLTLRGEALLVSLGLLCTAGWVGAVVLGRRSTGAAVFVAAAAIASPTLLEFATSGLENALTHLLLVGVVLLLAAGRERAAAAVAGLLLLDRLDAVVPLAPLVAVAVARGGWRSARAWLVALPVPVAWVAFATAYYGAPTPNTALAKLDTGLPWFDRAAIGVRYVAASVAWDPVAGVLLGAGLGVGLWRARRDPIDGALAGALAASVAFTAWIGGDFMAGRFLAAPVVLGLLVLARALDDEPSATLNAVVLLVGVGALTPWHPLGSTGARTAMVDGDVVDERAFWHRDRHPLLDGAEPDPVASACAGHERLVRVVATVGRLPSGAPLDVHVVDDMALADPLLVRLPLVSVREGWRAGHVKRQLPKGYLETLATGRNAIADPGIAACWDRVRAATRDPLLAPGRAGAIWALTTVGCDDLVTPHVGCDPSDPRFEPWCGGGPPEHQLEDRWTLLDRCAATYPTP